MKETERVCYLNYLSDVMEEKSAGNTALGVKRTAGNPPKYRQRFDYLTQDRSRFHNHKIFVATQPRRPASDLDSE